MLQDPAILAKPHPRRTFVTPTFAAAQSASRKAFHVFPAAYLSRCRLPCSATWSFLLAWIAVTLANALSISAAPPSLTNARSVDFVTDVAPILESHCLSCHNDVDRSGDLSLRTATDLFGSGAISADLDTTSRLIEMITPVDGSAEMPQDSPPLSQAQIDVLSQ